MASQGIVCAITQKKGVNMCPIIILMYHGYIRNKKSLCRQLGVEDAGIREEVEKNLLIEGYKKWGKEVVNHIYGSFAFAIHDDVRNETVCARDPFGICSFYYWIGSSGELVYSIDVRDIIDNEGRSKEMNLKAFQYYTMLGYMAGEETLYKNIYKLMPGQILICKNNKIKKEKYFELHYAPEYNISEEEWVSRIDGTLDCILTEDRNNIDLTGCYSLLSGGVDSSYLLAKSGVNKAYTVGYDMKNYSESDDAKETARALGVQLEEDVISIEDYFESLYGYIKKMEFPTTDPSTPVFALGMKHLSKVSDWCYSGEGADEFFAGYHVYKRKEEWNSSGAPLYVGCDGVMGAEDARVFLGLDNTFSLEELVEDIYEDTKGMDALYMMLGVDSTVWLEGDILFGAGISARKNGVNLVLPFLDRRFFELSSRIPAELKLKDNCGKYIFRKTASKYLNTNIAYRKKVGFKNPVRQWIRDERYRDKVEDVLFGDNSKALYNQTMLQKAWFNYLNGSDTDFRIIYSSYMLLIWYENVFSRR